MWNQTVYSIKFLLHMLLFIFTFWKSVLLQITRHSNKMLKGKIVDIAELIFSTTFNNSAAKKKKSLSKKAGIGM